MVSKAATPRQTSQAWTLLLHAVECQQAQRDVQPEGRARKALLRAMIEHGDVFVELCAGVIECLGFGYDEVARINPRIIYAQNKGFAPEGPFGQFLAFDMIAQAAAGHSVQPGEPDGRPLKRASTSATPPGARGNRDLAAIHQRDVSGPGQRIEVAMQESMINFGRIAYASQALSTSPHPGQQEPTRYQRAQRGTAARATDRMTIASSTTRRATIIGGGCSR
jgi:crotonobetainyl-CoA:carnitine CoA-transferase CaiB-like acyl-CoA transferase